MLPCCLNVAIDMLIENDAVIFTYIEHTLGTFLIKVPIKEESFDINYLAKKPKWMSIRSRMQKMMSFTIGKKFLEKSTPRT